MGNPDRNRSVAQLDGTPRRRYDVGGDLAIGRSRSSLRPTSPIY
jgi:hypothetical protein